jgi:hypothetical protein
MSKPSEVIDSTVLAEVLSEEFEDYQVNVTTDDTISITDSFPAGFYNPNELEVFEQSVREFVLQYTQEWDIETVTGNNLEGYYQALIVTPD